MVFHRKIRLDHDVYTQEGQVCSVTVCTAKRQPIFENGKFTESCINLLVTYAQRHRVPVYAYCFMPDHLHLLLSPSREKGIIDIVREYKGLTTRSGWNYGIEGTFWQKSFFDHFLRGEESVEHVDDYILQNPVRRGLVLQWKDYPYSGSLVFEL